MKKRLAQRVCDGRLYPVGAATMVTVVRLDAVFTPVSKKAGTAIGAPPNIGGLYVQSRQWQSTVYGMKQHAPAQDR
jgi:hypothetical protein